jgi:hypothetical protein
MATEHQERLGKVERAHSSIVPLTGAYYTSGPRFQTRSPSVSKKEENHDQRRRRRKSSEERARRGQWGQRPQYSPSPRAGERRAVSDRKDNWRVLGLVDSAESDWSAQKAPATLAKECEAAHVCQAWGP